MSYRSAEQVEKDHLKRLGPALGPVYHALYNECLWLHVKWHQYVELYGTKRERIQLLNRAARHFFRIVQDTLWEDTVLNLARLTDPPGTGSKKNLTIQCLPALLGNQKFRLEIQRLVNDALKATAFARDWRNKRIAHRDLATTLQKGSAPLAPASRNDIQKALEAVSRVLERVTKSEIAFNLVTDTLANDARWLLHVLRDGIEAEEKRRQRFRERKLEPEDLKPPRDI